MISPPPESTLFPYTTLFRSRTRLQRRLKRDLTTRGRSRTSVERQFREMVEPMHQRYVESQAKWADVVLAKPDRKSTRLNSSHRCISYAVFCLKKKKKSIMRC